MKITTDTIKKCCDRAIKNIIREGTTDVDLFNYPFEIEMLKTDEDIYKKVSEDVVNCISNALNQKNISELKAHKIGHVLIPKKSLSDYRKCALIEVRDEIIYLTLVLLMARDIETLRISPSKNRVFSYRYQYDESGKIFNSNYNFTSFREEVTRKSYMAKNKVLVECDLSNFYDRLNIHRIESVLRSSDKIESSLIDVTNNLLLYWANRDSYGIPVGSNASRILAEASLVEVDNYLISKGVDFCRFVDDYRIFAKDAYTAHSHLAILAHCLSREGDFLNTQKTRIIDISDKQEANKTDKQVSGITDKIVTETSALETKKTSDADKTDSLEGERGKIIRGYSGVIPTKFRELSDKQKERLASNDLKNMVRDLEISIIVEPKQILELAQTIVAQQKYEYFTKMPAILRKFPQFVPYFVDVIMKKGIDLSDDNKLFIEQEFEKWFEEESPEYIQVYLVRLFSSEIFCNKDILLKVFRNLKRNSGDYIGRALLEALDGKLTRGELLEIREYFYRADNWEKRQIVKMISKGIHSGENRPFYKDIQINTDDLWLKRMAK